MGHVGKFTQLTLLGPKAPFPLPRLLRASVSVTSKNGQCIWLLFSWKITQNKTEGTSGLGKIQEFAGGMKPTTRLILLVVVLSFIIGLAVAGTAVGLSWASATQVRSDALEKSLDLVVNAARSFTVTQLMKREVEKENICAFLPM